MIDLIQRLRSRPKHIRRRIAFITSGVVTGTIALAWLVGSITLGSFSLSNGPIAQDSELNSAVANTRDAASNLIGGAAASQPAVAPASQDGITVVDSGKPAAVEVNPASQTVLPF